MVIKVLSSMRYGGYKQAVSLADHTLRPLQQGVTVEMFTDVAMGAMNACGHWARKGMIRLAHNPFTRQPVIVILVDGRTVEPSQIQQLLMWAEENSVMDFLTQGSGIARTYNTDECPF